MADPNFPLLLFPSPTSAGRTTNRFVPPKFHRPDIARQGQRLAPKFETLSQAFEARRLALQHIAPGENPELVLVLEIVGSIQDFAKAVARIGGLEWLIEWDQEELVGDPDFYDEDDANNVLQRRLFLVASNQEALNQLLGLWKRYQLDPSAKFDHGLARFKQLFENLKDIRFWSVGDRVGADVRLYWEDRLAENVPVIRFEIEAWYYTSSKKNETAREQIAARLGNLGGQVLVGAIIPEIAYHGLLVEVPREAITAILAGDVPELLLYERIMFFRPKAQAVCQPPQDVEVIPHNVDPPAAEAAPVVALLDGLPQQNHPLLAGRLDVDDPDDWEGDYQVKDRFHGTSMASLIVHGDLESHGEALNRRLYVRPVLKPDLNDFHPRRREHTPDDVLLVDLVHRAVKRICEGDAGGAPAAPSVRVINLSIGDPSRVFDREISPWARLLDWLSFKYRVLIIVSAGNDASSLTVNVAQGTFGDLTADEQSTHALDALLDRNAERRLLAPAESINALTVGASHADNSVFSPVPGRFDLFRAGGVSPFSRVGHGFRRAVKPDLLMPGGRILFRERFAGGPEVTTLDAIDFTAAPGQRCAVSPAQGQPPNAAAYTRGTSNAAALASRAAAQAFDVIEALRAAAGERLPPALDAVLLKALLVHGATWSDWAEVLLARRPQLTQHNERKDFLARCLGYGSTDVMRALECSAQRATLIGTGELAMDEALIFRAPLPPSLAGTTARRRLTVTLAWLSPVNPAHQAYRRAKLSLVPPSAPLQLKRENSVHDKAAQRGTVQHEILESDAAVAFVDGDQLEFKVNCASAAGDFTDKIPFAVCLTLEVAPETGIAVYQEIRTRIVPQVQVQA